jgi:hypothetical protein
MALSAHMPQTFRWQETHRKPVPAAMAELLEALRRLRAEAAAIADEAYLAIQHHSYEPYWKFRAKIGEHAALVAVIRGRLPRLEELRKPDVGEIAAAADREEAEILILAVKSSLKFCFALSANPWLPIGARETFAHEIDALDQARRVLEKAAPALLPEGLLDEIGTAQMILEEIIGKAPSLTDFGARPAAAATAADEPEAATPVAAPETFAATELPPHPPSP